MYIKKTNWCSLIFLITLIVVFALLFVFIIFSKLLEYSKKVELCIELGGMFFTSLALLLTYNSLRAESEQKHLSIKPYLILNDIDFAIEKVKDGINQLDFDFSIINKGLGIANNINVIIKKKNNSEVLFESNYVNLDIVNNDIPLILSNIRDELNSLNKENHYSYGPYFNEMISDEFYIKNYTNEDEYKNLIVEISYCDIYGKKYKGIFDAILNEDFDLKDYKEKLKEL